MSLKFIRETYKVPAKVGMHVIANGQKGVIVGALGAYLRVRLEEGDRKTLSFHPTWEMEYLDNIGGGSQCLRTL